MASYSSKENKLELLETGIKKLDKIKFFLQILWEIKMIDDKKCVFITMPLQEVGRMVWRWKQSL